jgi:hypothetical protein
MNIELIEFKAKKLRQLKDDAWEMEKQLKEDLIQLDRDALNGLTWNEFMSSIKETIQVNEQMSIKRESYRIDGTYIIDENVTLTVSGNIYFKDERFSPTLHYKESGRYLSDVPKKYQKQYEEIVAEMKKYQFERPSDKYSKALGLTSF